MELQNGEMGKIQEAISSQLQEVTNRQQNLELVNQVSSLFNLNKSQSTKLHNKKGMILNLYLEQHSVIF